MHDAVVGTREDLSIDASITNIGLILTKVGDFLSRGTDRQTPFWNPHMEISTQSSKLRVRYRSLYASPDDGDG